MENVSTKSDSELRFVPTSSTSEPVPLGDGVVSGPDATPGKRPSKRPFLIVGLVILTGLVALVSYVMRNRGLESTDDARVEGDVVTVSVRVPGLVISVPAQDNHQIKKGDLIAQVDDTEYAARLKQAQAELAQTRAQAAQAEAQEVMVAASARGGIAAGQAIVAGSSYAVRSAHANIASARAAVERAEGDQRSAERDLVRHKTLLQANALAQSTLDDAQAATDRARATVAQARAALSASEADLHAADAQGLRGTRTPDAERTARNAVERRARKHRASTRSCDGSRGCGRSRAIAAGCHPRRRSRGRVTHQPVAAPGGTRGRGDTRGTPRSSGCVYRPNFQETQIGAMRPGQSVTVSVDAFAPRLFEGKVDTIAGGTQGRFSLLPSDNAAENFVKVVQRVPVKVRLAATEAVLLPGLSAGAP
ncbi:MAG: biotin/lipoyl-binding protein [Pseudomonadota bacterium]